MGRQGPSPEQLARLQEEDRQWRMGYFPPQRDTEGIDRQCVFCKAVLNPLMNRNYDATAGGYCNRLCMKEHERKLMYDEGMSSEEASVELDKYENWKPRRHSQVVS